MMLTCESAAGYLSISKTYEVVILSDVPQLTPSVRDPARRFITLIDILYENNTKLILSAAVPYHKLFDFQETQIFVEDTRMDRDVPQDVDKKEGGKEGAIQQKADGQIGISILELSGTKDIAFALNRALSRLREMQTQDYWDRPAISVSNKEN